MRAEGEEAGREAESFAKPRPSRRAKSGTLPQVSEPIGAVLAGKYHVKRRIGAGGMGAVYEGLHAEIGKCVADYAGRCLYACTTA